MWNSRGFEFGAVLFLSTIYPGTLLPMSVYALVRALAAIIFSSKIGMCIDSGHRLSVVRISIIGQRIAVILSCGLFSVPIQSSDVKPADYSSLLIFALLLILACFEKVFAIMNTVAIERDWVVVVAAEDNGILQTLNAQMRRIDLFCKLLSPLGIALLHSWSAINAVWATLAVNAVSVSVEYWFIEKVFHTVPSLRKETLAHAAIDDSVQEGDVSPNREESTELHWTPPRRFLTSLGAPLISYMGQAAFLPSFALSMLYLTVLSFSGQMITFLLALQVPKIPPGAIGLMRTASTLSELSSTWIAPIIMSRIGPVRAGIWFLSWQVISLSPAVFLLWTGFVGLGRASLPFFIIAVILSRLGLWSFDLCAQLIIQESTLPSQRGSFSSVEAALQNFFELCAFAMTIMFPRPQQFCYPALVSLLAVSCSAILFAKFVRNRRGHLLHMPSCLKNEQLRDINNYELLPAEPDSALHLQHQSIA